MWFMINLQIKKTDARIGRLYNNQTTKTDARIGRLMILNRFHNQFILNLKKDARIERLYNYQFTLNYISNLF